MMSLGQFRFSTQTAAYQSTQKTNQYRWQQHDVLGSAPRAQFLGLGEETVTLDGVIFPFYKGGLTQLDAMRREAKRGTPLLLIDAGGTVQNTSYHNQEHQTLFAKMAVPKKLNLPFTETVPSMNYQTQAGIDSIQLLGKLMAH